MASFKYKALSANGQEVVGVIEAIDQFTAVAQIKQSCPIIKEITEVQDAQAVTQVVEKKVDAKNLSLMCNRFATLLNVGLPIVDSIEMLARQIEDKNIKSILESVAKDVSVGETVASSFASHKGIFPVTFLEGIRSGEESGDLVGTFNRLSSYYEKTSKTKQKVIGSLTYPALTIAVAVVVMIIIMVVAVPTFTKTFEDMGTEMPGITKFVIAVSNFFINYGLMALAVITALVIGCRAYARTDQGAEFFSTAILAIPLIGNIVQMSAASQFSHTMSMMLSSGMPILSCIETAGKGIGNYVMRRDILAAGLEVEEGKSLASCLSKSRFLPQMLVEMIGMGESTGTLETTLTSVGDFYDNEVDIATARALSVMEPAIIGVLAVMVVVILFSVYLPMFSMYSGM